MRFLAFVAFGFLFGIGLAVSGMTDPAKVQAFLDVTGAWDASLMFVLGAAVLSFAFLSRAFELRGKPIFGGRFPGPAVGSVDLRLLVGAGLFGAGWGLLGLCPGPAVANLGLGRPVAVWFVIAMLVGMQLAQRVFGVDRAGR